MTGELEAGAQKATLKMLGYFTFARCEHGHSRWVKKHHQPRVISGVRHQHYPVGVSKTQ